MFSVIHQINEKCLTRNVSILAEVSVGQGGLYNDEIMFALNLERSLATGFQSCTFFYFYDFILLHPPEHLS